MPNPESKDIKLVRTLVEKAGKGTYFGDINLNFVNGEIRYFRFNKVTTPKEAEKNGDLLDPNKMM